MNSAENSARMTAGDGNARDAFDGVGERMKLIASKVDSKIYFHKDVLMEYMDIKGVISNLVEEKMKLEQQRVALARLEVLAATTTEELEAARVDLADAREKLAQRNQQLDEKEEELATATEELEAARRQLAERNHELDEKKEELKALRLKLREMETKNNQAEQQCGTKLIEPGEVQTISMKMKRRTSERTLGNDADNLEAIKEGPRQEVANNPTIGQTSGVQLCDKDDLEAIIDELIKGFLEIGYGYGRRKLGIKEMGELSEKAFKTACRAKVPPEEVGAAFDQLYSSWQQQLLDLSWYPFKSVTIDRNCQEIVNLDDDKLQGLKGIWGQDAHDAVVTALLEMKEYDRLSDRSIAFELWNYKEGRKATTK